MGLIQLLPATVQRPSLHLSRRTSQEKLANQPTVQLLINSLDSLTPAVIGSSIDMSGPVPLQFVYPVGYINDFTLESFYQLRNVLDAIYFSRDDFNPLDS